jgi:hypothetical protein
MVDVEEMDDLSGEIVGEKLAALTETDAPELHHYNQLMKLKTLAGNEDFRSRIDVQKVSDDIIEVMMTEPVAAMLKESHDESIEQYFGEPVETVTANFVEFATSRAAIQYLAQSSTEDQTYMNNHIVAIMARLDPIAAETYSKELIPRMLNEEVEYAMETGSILASAEETDGTGELTEEAAADRHSTAKRWVSFVISQGRNFGGTNLEWVSSLKSLNADNFEKVTGWLAEYTTQRAVSGRTLSQFLETKHELDPITQNSELELTFQLVREAEGNGALATFWGGLAAMSVVFDIVNMTDKARAGTLTDADWVALTGDVMQMGSGLGNGVPKLVESYQFWQKTRAAPLASVLSKMENEAALATFNSRFYTAMAGGDAAREAFIMDTPEFVAVLGLEGLSAADQTEQALAHLQRLEDGLIANGIDPNESRATQSFFRSLYNYSKNTGELGHGGQVYEETMEAGSKILSYADTGVDAAAAFAAEAAGTTANDAAVATGRATTWLNEMWEGETAGSSATGITAEAMGFVGLAGKAIGVVGSAANFFYSGVEVAKAVDEASADHPVLAGLHGAMAADFFTIGAASLGGSAAGLAGNLAYASFFSATAGWGVALLFVLQLATAIVEQLKEEHEKEILESEAEAASEGEVARELNYYYTRAEPTKEWNPDPSW